MRVCLGALTPTTSVMPPFMSVNFEKGEHAVVTIDVRGHAREVNGSMTYGPTARIVVTPVEWQKMLRELIAYSHVEGLL